MQTLTGLNTTQGMRRMLRWCIETPVQERLAGFEMLPPVDRSFIDDLMAVGAVTVTDGCPVATPEGNAFYVQTLRTPERRELPKNSEYLDKSDRMNG